MPPNERAQEDLAGAEKLGVVSHPVRHDSALLHVRGAAA